MYYVFSEHGAAVSVCYMLELIINEVCEFSYQVYSNCHVIFNVLILTNIVNNRNGKSQSSFYQNNVTKAIRGLTM